jgi:hypothetical protein
LVVVDNSLNKFWTTTGSKRRKELKVRPAGRVSVNVTFDTATVFGFVIVKFMFVVAVPTEIVLGLNDLVNVSATGAG